MALPPNYDINCNTCNANLINTNSIKLNTIPSLDNNTQFLSLDNNGNVKIKNPVIGSTGPTGPQGLIGQTGLLGPTGAQGLTGPIGSQGSTGLQGLIGPTGAQGLIGPTGSTGLQGLIGPTGSQGAIGPQGLQGATGIIGPAITPPIYLNSSNGRVYKHVLSGNWNTANTGTIYSFPITNSGISQTIICMVEGSFYDTITNDSSYSRQTKTFQFIPSTSFNQIYINESIWNKPLLSSIQAQSFGSLSPSVINVTITNNSTNTVKYVVFVKFIVMI